MTLTQSNRDDAFDKILNYLFSKVKTKKSERILGLQAIDTLQFSIGDDSFCDRITVNFDWIIENLSKNCIDVKLTEFFELLADFVMT